MDDLETKEYLIERPKPQDKGHFVWFGCLMLGIGVLLPWNALISAVGYYDVLLSPPNNSTSTSSASEDYNDNLARSFPFYMSIAYNVPSLPLLLFSSYYAHKVSFKIRIVACLACEFIVFGFITVIVGLSPPTDKEMISAQTSAWLLLVCCFFSGCFSALLFGAILSFTSILPPHYTTAVMSGNGIAGIIAGGLMSICKAALPATDTGFKTSVLIFFGITTLVFSICVGYFLIVLKSSFTQHHLDEHEQATKFSHSSSAVNPIHVFKKIWVLPVCVFSTFFITLSLFPGIAASICPQEGTISPDWFQILVIGLFQIFDFVGRTIPRWTVLKLSSKTIPIPTYIRLVFFPLFILCIAPKIFISNWWVYIWMFFFAISNGFVGSVGMMFGPAGVDDHEKPTAGYIMSLFLNSGIFGGVLFALAVDKWVSPPLC